MVAGYAYCLASVTNLLDLACEGREAIVSDDLRRRRDVDAGMGRSRVRLLVISSLLLPFVNKRSLQWPWIC